MREIDLFEENFFPQIKTLLSNVFKTGFHTVKAKS